VSEVRRENKLFDFGEVSDSDLKGKEAWVG
jgi:hypothetical protein